MLNKILLFLIYFYQKFISPYKGFRCAYSVYNGKKSCSNFGVRVMRKNLPIFLSLKLIRRRLDKCSLANFNHKKSVKNRYISKQAGFADCGSCDCGGGDCSIGDCGGLEGCNCDSLSCDSCSLFDLSTYGLDVCDCFGSASGAEREQARVDKRKNVKKNKKLLESDSNNEENELLENNDDK